MHKQALEYGGSDGDMFQSGYEAGKSGQKPEFEINDLYWAQGYVAGIWIYVRENAYMFWR